MGQGIQEGEKTSEGDIGLQRKDTEEVRGYGKGEKAKPGRRQQERPEAITDADQVKITCEHFFGSALNEWMDEVHDPRAPEQCTYSSRHLFWLGILMFLFRLGSRRQLLSEMETSPFRSNLLSLSGTGEKLVAHTDTLNYLLEMVEPTELEMVKVKMLRRLIADKRLDGFRLHGEFLVAVDGTGLFSFKEQHCDQCLKTEHSGGAVTWSHRMLDAKLVSENGFAMSMCSEPIENENGSYDKQDCELKAFYRLARKLKKLFPRVKICLLLDGLYACREVFDICRRNNWSFIIVFKEGSMPVLYADAVRRRNSHPKNSVKVQDGDSVFQKLSWAHNLAYHENSVHALFCEEHEMVKGVDSVTDWCWITDIRPSADNICELTNKGGRQRWKIENQGFKEQKQHDFELEHLYGEDQNAWKNYYQLLQIAHILTQLITHGDLCRKLQALVSGQDIRNALTFMEYYRSVRNFVRRLTESFRNCVFSEYAWSLPRNIQIRFSSA